MNKKSFKSWLMTFFFFLCLPGSIFSYGKDSSSIFNHYSAVQNLKSTYFSNFNDFINDLFITGESNLSELIRPLIARNNNAPKSAESSEDVENENDGYYSYEPLTISENKTKLLKSVKFRISSNLDTFFNYTINDGSSSRQGTLFRSYGETLFGCKFLDFTGVVGFSGVCYKTYVDSVSFNVPENDLLSATGVNVIETLGTERFDNIMNLALGFKDLFWLDAYLVHTTNYNPSYSALGSTVFFSYISYFGFDAQFENILNADLLFSSSGKVKEFSWYLNPYETVLSLLGLKSLINLNTKIGMQWKNWSELLNNSSYSSEILWSDFALAMKGFYSRDFGLYKIQSDTSICFHFENSLNKYYLEYFDQKIDFSRLFVWGLDENSFYFRLGIITSFSYYQNEKLQLYSDIKAENAFGFNLALYFSPIPHDFMRFEVSWKFNYADDLREGLGALNNSTITAKAAFQF